MTISRYVTEPTDEFLQLFPHRFDYLWAKHPHPEQTPNWETETHHPLGDRHIKDGRYLYGVRFGTQTQYLMLDIDRGSAYHPARDRFAPWRIIEALAPLGITDFVPVLSSQRGGIHLYIPLSESVDTRALAAAAAHLIKRGGFILQDGLLEVFPNIRNFDEDGPSLYRGHRLPLQTGSYQLSPDWNVQYTTHDSFCFAWKHASLRNHVNLGGLAAAAAAGATYRNRMSFKASKFLEDLNTDIEGGWTGPGQTNLLLGRITLRAYCFGHIVKGEEPLTGDRLIAEIIKTATQLPGYREWCRHQHEIYRRAEDWATCVENSRYYHYRFGKKTDFDKPSNQRGPVLTWNSWQKERARERITFAIADMLNRETLPAGTLERAVALTTGYGFSCETLYHHPDLWHPEHLWKTPPHPPASEEVMGSDCSEGASDPQNAPSLLGVTGRNTAPDIDQRAFWEVDWFSAGCNSASGADFSDRSEEERHHDPPD